MNPDFDPGQSKIGNRKSPMNTDVVQKLWGFCNTLRHDGINYGDYIE